MTRAIWIRRLGVRIPPGALPISVAPQPFRLFGVILLQDRIPLTVPLTPAVDPLVSPVGVSIEVRTVAP